MLTKQQKNDILKHKKLGFNISEISKTLTIDRDTITRYLKTGKMVMAISDLHCGHAAGLTPPKHRPYTPAWTGFYEQWDSVWQEYIKWANLLQPDILIVNGDAIDGKGEKSGGTEQICGTWAAQADMASECIMHTNAKKIVMTYGTPFHTGQSDDFENLIKDKLTGCEVVIGGHEFPVINGIQFDIKHKIGSSSVPQGRTTALNKSHLWNDLWAIRGQQPTAQVVLRGHVHYHAYTGNQDWLGMTLPALQGWGSKYGVRQCEGLVDTGITWFKVYEDSCLENLEWASEIFTLPCMKVSTYSL